MLIATWRTTICIWKSIARSIDDSSFLGLICESNVYYQTFFLTFVNFFWFYYQSKKKRETRYTIAKSKTKSKNMHLMRKGKKKKTLMKYRCWKKYFTLESKTELQRFFHHHHCSNNRTITHSHSHKKRSHTDTVLIWRTQKKNESTANIL